MTEVATTPGRLLSLDDWDTLEPVETRRMELVDGVVIMSPRPQVPHVVVTSHLIQLFAAAGRLALPEPDVVISSRTPATVRAPDLVLLSPDAELAEVARFEADELLLVIEIVSPGSRRTDYVAKRYDYEQAGIPFYWIIDPATRTVSCLELVDRAYREVPVPTGELVTLPKPVSITFDWEHLLGRA